MEVLQELLDDSGWKNAFLKTLRNSPRLRNLAKQNSTVAAILRQYANIFDSLARVDVNLPPVGYLFDLLNEEDYKSLLQTYQSDIFSAVSEKNQSSALEQKLSTQYLNLLEEFDDHLKDICGPDPFKIGFQFVDNINTTIKAKKDLPLSQQDIIASPEDKKGPGRKRRSVDDPNAVIDDLIESSKAKESKASDASVMYSTIGSYAQLDRDITGRKKVSNSNLQSSEVIYAVLLDMLSLGIDIFSDNKKLESSLLTRTGVFASESGTPASYSLLHMLQKTTASNSSQDLDIVLPSSVSRAASMVAGEHIKAWQEWLHVFDTHYYQVRKDLIEKQKKRWDALCGPLFTALYKQKFNLGDVPVSCDRIPNPFGSQGSEASSWNWLAEKMQDFGKIADEVEEQSEAALAKCSWPLDEVAATNLSKLDISSVFSVLLSELGETEISFEHDIPMWQRSMEHLRTLLCDKLTFGEDIDPAYNTEAHQWYREAFNATVSKALQTMSMNLNPLILLKGYEGKRDDSAVHRAMIIGSLAAFHLGSPVRNVLNKNSPSDPALANKFNMSSAYLNMYRNLFDSLRSESGPDESARKRNLTTENWGPVLIVTKMRDLDAFEASLGTIMFCQGIEVLPYYGSDSDRIVLRSYLRSVSSAGGLNQVGSGLYTERSHCHVILTSYETLLLDIHYFKEFQWFFVAFDNPWGFFHNSQYLHPAQQVLHILSARHRIFIAPGFSEDNYQPDIFRTASLVCPFMLGMTFAMKEGTVMIPPDFNRPGVLVNNGQDVLEIDAWCNVLLKRLLVAVTIVCPLYESVFITENANTLKSWESDHVDVPALCTEFMYILPSLEWSGIDPVVLPNGQMIAENDSVKEKYVLTFPEGGHIFKALTQLLVKCNVHLMTFNGVNNTGEFSDPELDQEIKLVNMVMVGKTGNSLPRVLSENNGSLVNLSNIEPLGFNERIDLNSFANPAVGGRGGPGRGKGRGRGRGRKNAEYGMHPSDSVASFVSDRNISFAAMNGGGGRGERGGRGKGRGRGRGKGEAQQQSNNMISSTAEQSAALEAVIKAAYDAQMALEIDENGEEEGNYLAEPDPNTSLVVEEPKRQKMMGENASEGVTEDLLSTPPAPTIAAEEDANEDDEDEDDDMPLLPTKRMTLEEEMSKYVLKRGKVYIASIIVAARQRYLGTFSHENEAKRAFEAAFHDRESILPTDAAGTGVMPGSAGNYSSAIKLNSKFKGKISKDVKLSDGSFMSIEYYRNFDDEGLYKDLKSMFYSTLYGGKSLPQWITSHNTPPVFAMLAGQGNISVPVPHLYIMLGRASHRAKSVLDSLGSDAQGCHGMVYRIYEGVASMVNTILSDSPNAERSVLSKAILTNQVLRENTAFSAVHVGFDESIARNHALLVYNHLDARFEVLAIANLFINGIRKTLQDGFTALRNKSIIQIGTEIFYFLLPTQNAVCSLEPASPQEVSNMQLRVNLLKSAISSLSLRAVMWPVHYPDSIIPSNMIQTVLNELLELEYITILAVSAAEESKVVKEKPESKTAAGDLSSIVPTASTTKSKKRKAEEKAGDEGGPGGESTAGVTPPKSVKKSKAKKAVNSTSPTNETAELSGDQIDAAIALSSMAGGAGLD